MVMVDEAVLVNEIGVDVAELAGSTRKWNRLDVGTVGAKGRWYGRALATDSGILIGKADVIVGRFMIGG